MLGRLLLSSSILVLAMSASGEKAVPPAPVRWSIDAKPFFNIGDDTGDTLDTFGEVAGVARISTGEVVVADRKTPKLFYFGPDGQFRRSVGRKGEGPGEFSHIIYMSHCGDSLYVQEWDKPTWLVLGEKGGFKRNVTLYPMQTGQPPYRTFCNKSGTFLAHGWEDSKERKAGYFRPNVPLWLSGPDGKLRADLGVHPGVERIGRTRDGRVSGTGPYPLGKQLNIAIGNTRVYFGTADSFAIDVYTLDGKPAGKIRKAGPLIATTTADVQRGIAIDTVGESEASKKSTMERTWLAVPMPKTLPAYADMIVDRDDFLWVQRYPRGGEKTVHWHVFSPTGVEIAEIDLPVNLKVHEIGHDYVLGVETNLGDGVQHVLMYRLKRGT